MVYRSLLTLYVIVILYESHWFEIKSRKESKPFMVRFNIEQKKKTLNNRFWITETF